jgi:beta-phosphoglucomutase-like phosphatase (HAD superfamily)
VTRTAGFDRRRITTVLCDADGTLFPSEEPAFRASAVVSRALAERYGLIGDFSAEALRRSATGRNFRSTTADLFAAAGRPLSAEELDEWVQREKEVVTDHLAAALVVEADVVRAVKNWAQRYRLAVVSSSATSRLDACFAATGLDEWFPAEVRFSAEDSLAEPVSKPDPAVYRHALQTLRCPPDEAVAVEDSTSGAAAAIAAGIPTLGIVQFAATTEEGRLAEELVDLGVAAVARTWPELENWL